ncbi:hypothetical protein B7H23_07530 [Notoacmeibacter marinus]|uniref:Uncharacterized protein n=1 Tax=Notoacmeibacter marinus TaxID=1876515 RepID=A0A231V3F9_9HYPH|nr:DUF1178 family protein [Notoacmeibacter marinus]OXT02723.1 hypothetical protein B7H23_07530 [Notoacmeibacter marinus]
MIRYDLRCVDGHRFDGWFRSSDDFDTQKRSGFVICPHCQTSSVEKILMAPAVRTSGEKRPVEGSEESSSSQPQSVGLVPDSPQAEAMRKMAEMVRQMKAKATNVGDRFAEEARRIHFGEAEQTEIYGSANAEDVQSLLDDGVPVLPLPDLPEDQN